MLSADTFCVFRVTLFNFDINRLLVQRERDFMCHLYNHYNIGCSNPFVCTVQLYNEHAIFTQSRKNVDFHKLVQTVFLHLEYSTVGIMQSKAMSLRFFHRITLVFSNCVTVIPKMAIQLILTSLGVHLIVLWRLMSFTP